MELQPSLQCLLCAWMQSTGGYGASYHAFFQFHRPHFHMHHLPRQRHVRRGLPRDGVVGFSVSIMASATGFRGPVPPCTLHGVRRTTILDIKGQKNRLHVSMWRVRVVYQAFAHPSASPCPVGISRPHRRERAIRPNKPFLLDGKGPHGRFIFGSDIRQR